MGPPNERISKNISNIVLARKYIRTAMIFKVHIKRWIIVIGDITFNANASKLRIQFYFQTIFFNVAVHVNSKCVSLSPPSLTSNHVNNDCMCLYRFVNEMEEVGRFIISSKWIKRRRKKLFQTLFENIWKVHLDYPALRQDFFFVGFIYSVAGEIYIEAARTHGANIG